MNHAIQIEHLDFCYGTQQVLFDVSMNIPALQVTALIGPSGCGKSTLLRCLNRINDRSSDARVTSGSIKIHGIDIMRPDIDLLQLRRHVGMVFQKYNPFPKSIFENVAYSSRIAGIKDKAKLNEIVETSLRDAALWEDVKDRLQDSALGLSVGQQQRLCIARAIANRPEILLMDEPCGALDPLATLKIEQLIQGLKKSFTIVIVTHNMAQASRCSDKTAFMHQGKVIEFGDTTALFSRPTEKQTEQYITGSFG